jgi:hypothetical protein
MSRVSRLFIAIMAVLCVAPLAHVCDAQVITGTILGNVTDESKAPLPGVTLTLKNLDTGMTRAAITDSSGSYRAAGLSLGNYEVRTDLAGFQPKVRTGISVTVGREAVVNFSLGMAAMTEAIVVQGEAPMVNTTESTLSYTVNEKTIRDLPLNGRDFASLILMQPGVTMSRSSENSSNVGRGIKISVAGARPNQNLFTLDGTDYNDALNNTPASAQGMMTGVETIKEFQVLTNTMSAEYGRASGGVFNVVTKSGTNDFHGSLFEFHRDKNLDSSNYFDPEKPEFRRNQFGGSFGGPVLRDRTFFFGSYEGLREFKEITTVATVPDNDARRGVLPGVAAINIPAAIIPYLNLYPTSDNRILNSSGNPTGFAEFRGVNPRDSYQNFAMARLDHTLSEQDTAFVRYVYDKSELDQPVNFPAFPNIVRNEKHVGTVEERHLFSPTTLNETRLGVNISKPSEDINPLDPHTDIAFVTGKAFGEINVTGLTDMGTDRTNPKAFYSNVYQLTDNFSLVKGEHALKTGVNYEHFKYNGNSETRTRGRLRFRNLTDLLRGRTRDFELAKPGSDFQRDYSQNLVGLFVQDDFRIGSRLVLNGGLRWEFVTTPKEKNGKVSNLRNFSDSTVSVGGDLFKNHTKKDIAPRLGFVWDVGGNGKTAIRGGYGLFYDPPLFFEWRNPIFRSLPFVDRARVTSPTLPIDPTKVTVSGPSDTESFQYDLDPIYVTQYNINIQRELGILDSAVMIGYVGSRGHNLLGQGDVNIAVPQIRTDGTEFFPSGSVRRNPNFGVVRAIMQGFRSRYNGVHFELVKRRTQGFQFQTSYTYGKTEDNRSGSGGRQEYANGQARTFDPYDFDKDWGRADYDVRHNLVLNTSYDLPFWKGRVLGGWQLNLVGTFASGVPFSPIIPGDPDRDATDDNAARPNLIAGCNPKDVPGGRSPNMWFNPACFAFPELGTRGNAKRNSLEGPDYRVVDMSLVKTTPISGAMQAQIRLEVFNILNRANFDIPANNADGEAIFDDQGNRLSDAGKIFRTVTDGRSFQIAVRLLF